MTVETFNQSDGETWHDQQKYNENHKGTDKTFAETMTKTFREHPQRATIETCDLWGIWSDLWGDMSRVGHAYAEYAVHADYAHMREYADADENIIHIIQI